MCTSAAIMLLEELAAYILAHLPTFSVGTVMLTMICYIIFRREDKKQDKPPGPKGLPLYGNLLDIRKSEANGPGLFVEWAHKYGDIYSIRLGAYDAVILNSKDSIREAFLKNGDVTSGRCNNLFFFRILFGKEGILLNEGDRWKQLRRACVHAMRDFGMGKKSMEVRIQEESRALVDVMDKTEMKPFNPRMLFHHAFGNIISSIMFGERHEYDDPDFQLMAKNLTVLFAQAGFNNPELFVPILTPFIPIINPSFFEASKAIFHVKAYISQKIKQHKDLFDPNEINSFVDIYLKAVQDGEMDDSRKGDLLVSIFDLFIAGTETPTTTLQWTLLLFTHYPEVQSKCQQEIRKIIGQARLPTTRDREQLVYVDATIFEVLRFANISPYGLMHRATEDVELSGYLIQKDTMILPNIQKLHMDPEYWGDPKVFRPERWIGKDGRLIKHDSFMPFSTGLRECMGKSLALQGMFIVLVSLLQRFTFSAKNPENPPPLTGPMGVSNAPSSYEIIASKY